MLLLAIMGTDVVQLESRLVEEDLLLCNIKRGGEKEEEEGRKRECKLFDGSSREFFGNLCTSNSLGLEPAWEKAKAKPWV